MLIFKHLPMRSVTKLIITGAPCENIVDCQVEEEEMLPPEGRFYELDESGNLLNAYIGEAEKKSLDKIGRRWEQMSRAEIKKLNIPDLSAGISYCKYFKINQ